MRILIFTAILMATTSAFARGGATGTGGGGKDFVCRDQNKQIVSAELLDLWEARVLYSREIAYPITTLREQVYAAIEQISKSMTTLQQWADPNGSSWIGADVYRNMLKVEADRFLDSDHDEVHWLPGTSLTLTEDSYEMARPSNPGCAAEQVVIYRDNLDGPTIMIDKDIFEHMNSTNQAALIVHESLYAFLRQNYTERSSLRVRRTVGLAFSNYQFHAPQDILPRQFEYCESDKWDYEVYLFADVMPGSNQPTVNIQPIIIDGQLSIDGRRNQRFMGAFSSIEDFLNFNDPRHPVQYHSTMSPVVGFDYEYAFWPDPATHQLYVQLWTAPDLVTRPDAVALKCKPETK